MRCAVGIGICLMLRAVAAQEPPAVPRRDDDRPPSTRRRNSGAPAAGLGDGSEPEFLYHRPAGPDPVVPLDEAVRRIQAHIDHIHGRVDLLAAVYEPGGMSGGEYVYAKIGGTPAFRIYRNPCDSLQWSLQAVQGRGSARASELRYLDEGMQRWAPIDRKVQGMFREWADIMKKKRASGNPGADDDFEREFNLCREMLRTSGKCFENLPGGGPEAPAGAEVRCYAKGASGLRPVSALVAGVPSVVEIAWAEPPEKDECDVEIAAGGGTLMLKARRTKDERRVYRTAPFLPWPAEDILGPPPPR